MDKTKIYFILILLIVLKSCGKNKQYYTVNGGTSIERCNYCKDSINTARGYQTIILTKEKNTAHEIKNIDDKPLYNFHSHCADRFDFEEKLKIYNIKNGDFRNPSGLNSNSFNACNNCGKELKNMMYYTLETRIEKDLSDTIYVEDAMGHIILCEACVQEYDFKKLQILVK